MHDQQLNRQDEIGIELVKSCQSSEKVTVEVAGTVPSSEQPEAREGGAAEKVLLPGTREGCQGEHLLATGGLFEAFVRATRSINESEWWTCDHPLDPLFPRALCQGREASITC